MRLQKLILVMTAGAMAAAAAGAPPRWQTTCIHWRDTAAHIMHARQRGIPMRAEQQTLQDQPGQPTVSSLISKAYDEPVFATHEKKTQAIQAFRRSVYSVCAHQLGDRS